MMRLSTPVCAAPNRIIQPPAEITLHYGDVAGNGCRAMLRCDTKILAGERHDFRFGIKLDTSWPVNHPVKFSHIISQWRQNPGSPKLALMLTGDEWIVNGQAIGKALPGVFTEFEFDIRLAVAGRCTVRMDGKQVHDEDCQTIADDERPVSWTAGIYRPWWQSHDLVDGEPSFRKLWMRQ